jgi:flagellar motor component MotA
MFAIVGIVLVFGAVIGGFLMEKGHIEVLVQPAELLIIGGPQSARSWWPTRCIFSKESLAGSAEC